MGGIFSVACLGGCIEGVVHTEMVSTCCFFRVLRWCVGGQLWALKSGVGECPEVAKFVGFVCQISLEVSF